MKNTSVIGMPLVDGEIPVAHDEFVGEPIEVVQKIPKMGQGCGMISFNTLVGNVEGPAQVLRSDEGPFLAGHNGLVLASIEKDKSLGVWFYRVAVPAKPRVAKK